MQETGISYIEAYTMIEVSEQHKAREYNCKEWKRTIMSTIFIFIDCYYIY